MEKFIKRIDDTYTDRTDQDAIELMLFKTCKEATGKEERLVRDVVSLLLVSPLHFEVFVTMK